MDPGSALRLAELARQRDFLCRLARGLLGDAARAEDVVQDALVLAVERPPREERALAAWLGRVVRHLSLNELRRAERAQKHERVAARPEGQGSHAEAAASLDAHHFVLVAVRALEEPYKTTIWLRYYENLSPASIAAREGLPVKTVKTRLSRALERLRAELDRSSGGDRAAWGALLLPLAQRAPGAVGAGPGILGGVLAMKKLVAVLVVLAFVLLTWRTVGPGKTSPDEDAFVVAAPGVEASAARGDPVPEAAPRSAHAREALAVERESSDSEHASAGATLLVHATFERDGTDAAGVGLLVLPLEDPQPDLRAARAETDAGGRARFEGCAPGAFAVHTDRGGRTEVELSAGATQELEVVIAAGVDVTGVVVDRAGQPVPEAEIWLSRVSRYLGDGWLAGEIVARADGQGAFFLRSVGPRQSVGAFAPGFAPALLEELKEKSWTADDPRVHLTLVLEREGAVLEGRVIDEQGAPVPGASVVFGYAGMSELPRADGRFGNGPTPRAVVSDELGRFRADWLEPGPTSVFALAEDHAMARVDVTASSVCAEPVVVALARGVTITGNVHDATGHVLPGAEISVLRAGDLDGACPFSLPETTSSADGAFRIECVPAGEITLSARQGSDLRMRGRATRTIADGATEAWDLVLEAAPSITGRAVDGAGHALARWTVSAGSGPITTSFETDDEGRFVVVVRDPGEAWTLALVRAGVAHDRAENVHAGDVVELVGLDPDELGRIEGGFADVARRVPDGERVFARLVSEVSPHRPSADLVGGRFFFEGATRGRYVVRVQTADRVLAESAPFDVAPGATVDVGLLCSRPAGSLVVEFVLPPGITLPDGYAYVSTDADGHRVLVRRDGEWRADDLDPGRGAVFTYFPGLAQQQWSFEVQEGSETRLSVVLERAVERTLAFVPPPGTTCQAADILVRSPSWELYQQAIGAERPEITLMLAPGSYEVEATTGSGLTARGVLEIPDLLLESAEVVFELR